MKIPVNLSKPAMLMVLLLGAVFLKAELSFGQGNHLPGDTWTERVEAGKTLPDSYDRAKRYPEDASFQVTKRAKEYNAKIVSEKRIDVILHQHPERSDLWYGREVVMATFRKRSGAISDETAERWNDFQAVRELVEFENPLWESLEKVLKEGVKKPGKAGGYVSHFAKGARPVGYLKNLLGAAEKAEKAAAFTRNIRGNQIEEFGNAVAELNEEVGAAIGDAADSYSAMSPQERSSMGPFHPREAADKMMKEKAANGEELFAKGLVEKMRSVPDHETVKETELASSKKPRDPTARGVRDVKVPPRNNVGNGNSPAMNDPKPPVAPLKVASKSLPPSPPEKRQVLLLPHGESGFKDKMGSPDGKLADGRPILVQQLAGGEDRAEYDKTSKILSVIGSRKGTFITNVKLSDLDFTTAKVGQGLYDQSSVGIDLRKGATSENFSLGLMRSEKGETNFTRETVDRGISFSTPNASMARSAIEDLAKLAGKTVPSMSNEAISYKGTAQILKKYFEYEYERWYKMALPADNSWGREKNTFTVELVGEGPLVKFWGWVTHTGGGCHGKEGGGEIYLDLSKEWCFFHETRSHEYTIASAGVLNTGNDPHQAHFGVDVSFPAGWKVTGTEPTLGKPYPDDLARERIEKARSELKAKCGLEIRLETRDLFSNSIFEKQP